MFRSNVLVCGGTGCTSSNSEKIIEKLKEEISAKGLDQEVNVVRTGCFGLCALGPIMIVYPEGAFYSRVTPEDVPEIVEEHLLKGRIVRRLLYKETVVDENTTKSLNETTFYAKQMRVALRNCGVINPEQIDEYIALDGYQAIGKILTEKIPPQQVIQTMLDSGLRGRGGAGFPTGLKWKFAAANDADQKYVCCNADEGDPGAFMDCSIMEGIPHKMIEGMIIAGVATGSENGCIYVRAEYPHAVERLTKAIAQAEEYGLIGENILGSGKTFKLKINKGAGAFVCGEGSAMTTSIEGNRGTPRTKPPRSVDHGLFNAPTCLNNVETFANVPVIINKGSKWFRSIGTEGSSGTKAFSLAGNIRNTGLIEVPMGTTLKEIVFDIGGGVKTGKFKSVQVGGPSGGCLTEEHLDLPLDYDSLKKIGAIMGSGGLVVMGDDTCMVEIARFFMSFTKNESCGKCTTCRMGIPKIQAILERITQGEGTMEDLDELEKLSKLVKTCSLCGLGKTATNPVMSTLRYFKDEYIAHVQDKKCPAHVCKPLFEIRIDPEKCIGCTKCAVNCATGAITGKLMRAHSIDLDKCTRCRTCIDGCPTEAIEEV